MSLRSPDLRGGIVLPRFVEVHTHLDKGHIWWRIQNDNGTVHGARTAVTRDREENWSAEDVRTRMNFALKSAYAMALALSVRTIDSYDKQTAISFGVSLRRAPTGKTGSSCSCCALPDRSGCNRRSSISAYRRHR